MAKEIRHLFKGFFLRETDNSTVLATWCGKGMNNAYIEPRLLNCEACGAARKLFLDKLGVK